MRKMWIMILTLAAVLVLTGCGMRAEEHEYAEYFAEECKVLEKISKDGFGAINDEIWLSEYLFCYHVQPDGHGLAFTLHPYGLDASGTTPMVIYETSDGGKNWNLLCERFDAPRGWSVFVYMGETVVLVTNHSKSDWSTLMISYDRGRTWSEYLALHELMDYDHALYDNIDPYVINYNEHTGIITFGWKDGSSAQDAYLLINQFDANTCQFVEEVYRSPDFPRAP